MGSLYFEIYSYPFLQSVLVVLKKGNTVKGNLILLQHYMYLFILWVVQVSACYMIFYWLLHAKTSHFSLEIITWLRHSPDVAEGRFGQKCFLSSFLFIRVWYVELRFYFLDCIFTEFHVRSRIWNNIFL